MRPQPPKGSSRRPRELQEAHDEQQHPEGSRNNPRPTRRPTSTLSHGDQEPEGSHYSANYSREE
jgi:hypothetical protein